MRLVQVFRVAAALALLAAFAALGAERAGAQDSGFTITTHAAECYEGVGASIFEECHKDVAVDVATFDNGDGTVTMTIDEAALAGYLGAYVYCRDLVDDEVLYDGSYADGVAFPVEDGDDIVCDVYLILPAADGGATDGGTADTGTDTGSGTGAVTTLPTTGVGQAASGQTLPMLLAALVFAAAGVALTARRRAPR